MKAGTGHEVGEGLFSYGGLEEEGDETRGEDHPEGSVEGKGPVFCDGEKDVPGTGEDIRENRSQVEEDAKRDFRSCSVPQLERPFYQVAQGHVCDEIRHASSIRSGDFYG